MRRLLASALAIAVGIGAGCTLMRPVKGPYVPHPGQKVWVDETAVINLVTRFVYEAHFDERRPLVEKRYATLVRYWYEQASSGRQDHDGGCRAVNFIHKIHLDAGGSREFWKQIVYLARQPAPGQTEPGLPPDVE